MKSLSIAIVDDEKNIRRALEIILKNQVKSLQTFDRGEALLASLAKKPMDVVFLDVQLPGMDGVDTLIALKKQLPECDVVMISGHASLSTAVAATRAGAYDFLEKPLQKEKILITLKHLAERRALRSRNAHLQETVADNYRIVGESAAIRSVLVQVEKVAGTDSKVLITGESGVGKELVAYAIHHISNRVNRPFVKMNCAAIPEDLVESELFGSEKGAFTGATERREGRFSQADGGTLFLDEIGDMSLRVQTKVLRVLNDGDFQRVGGSETLSADVRVIAATNKPLKEMVSDGRFREDLFYRLNVLPIRVPPLRERPEDVLLLVEHFCRRFCERNNRRIPVFEESALRLLKGYHWPGNIRELQNLVERLIILSEGHTISAADIPADIGQMPDPAAITPVGQMSLPEVREAAERRYIERCLAACDGNVSQTARMLGIERTNLHKKIKALGIR